MCCNHMCLSGKTKDNEMVVKWQLCNALKETRSLFQSEFVTEFELVFPF